MRYYTSYSTDKLLWGEDMLREKIKPIPKYIEKLIHKKDEIYYDTPDGHTRYYAYLTTNNKELVKVTVAVKHHKNDWYCKQVAVHGIHSKKCFVKDMDYYWIAGYTVGWFKQGIQKHPKCCDDGIWYTADDKWFDPYAPIVNKKYLDKYPEYKYSQVENYRNSNIFKYLRLYEKYPQMEYFMKLGLDRYVTSKMMLSKASKDTVFCKWLGKNKNKLNGSTHYDVPVVLNAYSKHKNLDLLQRKANNRKELKSSGKFKNVKKLFGDEGIERFLEYLSKQQIDVYSYFDYIRACEYLNLDLTDTKHLIPKNFKFWHDKRIEEVRILRRLEDEKKRQEQIQNFVKVANKYLPLQKEKDGYVTLIAKSPNDLVNEGQALSHCVGDSWYSERFANEQSLIFFVRQINEADKPYVTLEYSLPQKKILQCYAEQNHKPNDETMRYIYNVWLPFANRQLRKIQQATA